VGIEHDKQFIRFLEDKHYFDINESNISEQKR